MKLFRLVSMLTGMGVSLLIQPARATAAISDIFDIIPSGNPGNCDKYNVDEMLKDARTLSENGMNAANAILLGGISTSPEKMQHYVSVAKAVWKIKMEQTLELEGRIALSKVEAAYKKANEMLDGSNNGTHRGKFICGGDDWEYKDDQKGPESDVDPETELGMPARKWYTSKYWGPKESQSSQRPVTFKTYTKNGQPSAIAPCATTSNSQAHAELQSFVMMCDMAFAHSNLEDLVAKQESWPWGLHVDKIDSPGSLFLNAMMKYIDGKNSSHTPSSHPSKYDNTAGPSSLPLRNMSNYATFALAVTFDRVKWSNTRRKE